MAEPKAPEAQFTLQDYYQRPENYRGVFARHLPHLDILMNTIYWDDRYPRLVTRRWARSHYGEGHQPRLQVIGDISCDIGGGIELNVGATDPDEPCYVFDPVADAVTPGVAGEGPVIMSVDNLPCELPREASTRFSQVLRDMVPALAAADFATDFASLQLPAHLKRAVVAHRGELAPDYRYLQASLDRHAS
jgi:alpha-aminoadipic semialdehyde synthase